MRINARLWGKKLKARVVEYMTRPRMVIGARSFYSRADMKLYLKKRIALTVFLVIVDLYIGAIVVVQTIPMVSHALASESVVLIRDPKKSSNLPSEDTNRMGSHDGTVSAVPNIESEEGSAHASAVITLPSEDSIEGKILKAWEGTGEGHIALAVAKAESGLKSDAKGWNCRYTDADGKTRSRACLPQDRHKAWSVDCGIMQINVIGKECLPHLYDVDENIKIGRDMYSTRGFTPWSVYKNNSYLKHL